MVVWMLGRGAERSGQYDDDGHEWHGEDESFLSTTPAKTLVTIVLHFALRLLGLLLLQALLLFLLAPLPLFLPRQLPNRLLLAFADARSSRNVTFA